jgi:uncharacterized UBP type Zn finger protein
MSTKINTFGTESIDTSVTETLLKTRQQLIEQKKQIENQLIEIDTKLESICHHSQVIRCVKNELYGISTYKCNSCGLPTNLYLWSVIIKTEYV